MSKELTESRLHAALNRLLEGKPVRVKSTGKLTLNKINNEAGLGNSYIHKFTDFLEYANPIIEEHNVNREKAMATGLGIDVEVPLSELDRLRSELARERKLKDRYRLERDNAIAARKILEAEHANLMFRALEMQEEIATLKPVARLNVKKP